MPVIKFEDGRRFNYTDLGQGHPLVLLHGWSMSSGVFADVSAALKSDFRLLIPDLRGHDGSDPGLRYELSDFVVDLYAWFKLLGLDRCYVVGWSFGGQIAMQLVADHLLPIKRLIVVSSTPKFCQSDNWKLGLPDVQVRAMQRRFSRDPESTRDDFMSLMFAGEANASKLTASAASLAATPDPDAGLKTLTTLKNTDIRNQLAEIQIPTLVHHGRADAIIPVSAGEYIAKKVRRCEQVIWDDVGHAPFISRPEDSHRLWKDFLI